MYKEQMFQEVKTNDYFTWIAYDSFNVRYFEKNYVTKLL